MSPRFDQRRSGARASSASRRSGDRRWTVPDRGGRIELVPPAIVLIAAILFGGSANPLCDMLVDCLGVLLFATLAIRFDAGEWRRSRLGWLMLLVTLAVAAIELVPLPFSLWRTLPGRAAPAALLEALAIPPAARPLSLDPNASLSTLLQVIPGLAVFTAALAAGARTRRTLTGILIAGVCVNVVLGSLQMAGQQQFYFYERSNVGNVTGLFANRNHAADMFLIGIALFAGRLRELPPGRSAMAIPIVALMLTMAVAVLLTISRFGITLLVIETLALIVFLRPPTSRRNRITIAIALVVGIVLAGLLTLNSGVISALDRFSDFSHDLRGELSRRTAEAAIHYWPVGSGLGTFKPVYVSVERLDTMTDQIVNHAHDEYLELACELGLVGVLIVLGYVAALGSRIVTRIRQGAFAEIVPALLGIGALLASSAVEFPLRNESLMVAFGLLNAGIFCAVRESLLNNR